MKKNNILVNEFTILRVEQYLPFFFDGDFGFFGNIELARLLQFPLTSLRLIFDADFFADCWFTAPATGFVLFDDFWTFFVICTSVDSLIFPLLRFDYGVSVDVRVTFMNLSTISRRNQELKWYIRLFASPNHRLFTRSRNAFRVVSIYLITSLAGTECYDTEHGQYEHPNNQNICEFS